MSAESRHAEEEKTTKLNQTTVALMIPLSPSTGSQRDLRPHWNKLTVENLFGAFSLLAPVKWKRKTPSFHSTGFGRDISGLARKIFESSARCSVELENRGLSRF